MLKAFSFLRRAQAQVSQQQGACWAGVSAWGGCGDPGAGLLGSLVWGRGSALGLPSAFLLYWIHTGRRPWNRGQ